MNNVLRNYNEEIIAGSPRRPARVATVVAHFA
jgi:hypothetical protein